MKINVFLISIFSFLLITQIGFGQNKPANALKTETFKVWGNCEMCKETIEGALDKKGIKSAKWNQATKMMTVTFHSDKISLEQIHKLIAEVGYDTELEKGNDKAYADLPGCCHYERRK